MYARVHATHTHSDADRTKQRIRTETGQFLTASTGKGKKNDVRRAGGLQGQGVEVCHALGIEAGSSGGETGEGMGRREQGGGEEGEGVVGMGGGERGDVAGELGGRRAQGEEGWKDKDN